MKISCLPVSYFKEIINGKMSIMEWVYQAKDLGLYAVDLSILFIEDRNIQYLDSLRREIEEIGMKIAMVTTSPDFTHPNEEKRKSEIIKNKRDICIASHLGAEIVRVTAGQNHPTTYRQEGINWAVNGLMEVLAYAENKRISLAFENHVRASVWNYNDFCYPTRIFLEIFKRTEGTSLGVNFDTANTIAYGDNPIPVLNKILHRVVSIHAADTSTKGELKHVLIGSGLVPFKDIFKILKVAAFGGWICIEEASFLGRKGVKSSIEFINQAWNEA